MHRGDNWTFWSGGSPSPTQKKVWPQLGCHNISANNIVNIAGQIASKFLYNSNQHY